eukprot:3913491-Prymnesium_polylepis.1
MSNANMPCVHARQARDDTGYSMNHDPTSLTPRCCTILASLILPGETHPSCLCHGSLTQGAAI